MQNIAILEFLKEAENLRYLEYSSYMRDVNKFYRDVETVRVNQRNKKLLLLKLPVGEQNDASIDTEHGDYVRVVKGEN